MGDPRRLTLMTFGFKYGYPETNHYFDVSFLRNPAREPRWSLFTKPSREMREYILEQPECKTFLDAAVPLIKMLVESDDDVRIGIGCSSGRHRSYIVAEELRRIVETDDVQVKLIHREEQFQ